MHDGAARELYDHGSDPTEQRNIATEATEAMAELAPLVDAYKGHPAVVWGSPDKVEVDSMRLEQLRALGYVIK